MITSTASSATTAAVRVAHADLLEFTSNVFAALGLPAGRAAVAAEALCHGDLTGMVSHGLTNLRRLYLPLLTDGRAVADADPVVLSDRGATVLWDGNRTLGLWSACAAVDLAADRASEHGVGVVTVRNGTHIGCAGFHTARAAARGMVGLLVSNCGRQRIARPPGGRPAMLGTNPLSLAAPAGTHAPFVLDMSTTVVPTGRVRVAARAGLPVPEGWLEDGDGKPVTDAAAFDQGKAYLRWLGGDPATGGYKGYGLGLLVEVLGALVPGAGMGPEPEALNGTGSPTGRDDDIGFTALVLAPASLRPGDTVTADAERLFGTLLACPPLDPARPVAYPGWHEARLAADHRRDGTPLSAGLYGEIAAIAEEFGVPVPRPIGA